VVPVEVCARRRAQGGAWVGEPNPSGGVAARCGFVFDDGESVVGVPELAAATGHRLALPGPLQLRPPGSLTDAFGLVSAASALALIRASIRPSAVLRSSSPDTTVASRTPVDSGSRISSSSSNGRRVSRLRVGQDDVELAALCPLQ